MNVSGIRPWSMLPLTFPKYRPSTWYSLKSVKNSVFFLQNCKILVDLKAFENKVASPFNVVLY